VFGRSTDFSTAGSAIGVPAGSGLFRGEYPGAGGGAGGGYSAPSGNSRVRGHGRNPPAVVRAGGERAVQRAIRGMPPKEVAAGP
jgi:hypothetical protein